MEDFWVAEEADKKICWVRWSHLTFDRITKPQPGFLRLRLMPTQRLMRTPIKDTL